MLTKHADVCAPHSEFSLESNKVHFILAIENASGLLEENENFTQIYSRVDAQDWLYISLTWNEENRFGGGNHTNVGLKRDGEHLLEYMDGKQIAIDLSHTSVALANDILNHIHKKNLKLIPIASHSNFRQVLDHRRNLPDAIAKEILALGGIIGINFIRPFIGEKGGDFISHIEHAFTLGAQDQLCLGADFFGGIITSSIEHLQPFFQKDFANASCYPTFFKLLEQAFSEDQIKKIAHQNALSFIKHLKS